MLSIKNPFTLIYSLAWHYLSDPQVWGIWNDPTSKYICKVLSLYETNEYVKKYLPSEYVR